MQKQQQTNVYIGTPCR